jgi:protein-L-isoaspartate(D-aspartate) O-methyltransferase
MTFDVEQARFNMIEQQIRTWEVLDQDVLDLLFKVRREDYVPPAHRALAFADLQIPIGEGQVMWQPKIEARALQELAVMRGDRALEIGTGSGYFAALLARQAASVVSVEYFSALGAGARAKLAAHGVRNVTVEVGDGARGWGQDQYDVIVLTGSTPILPKRFLDQLAPGGRLFAIVGELPVMTGQLVVCDRPGAHRVRKVFETVVDPLVNAEQREAFAF